jgi:AraC-like DNA-binding protein/ligand-binding sensor protein
MDEGMGFVFDPQLQAIFDHFCALHGIRIAFHTPEGGELRVGQSRPLCAYCRILRRSLGTESACLRLDRAKRQEAAAGGAGPVAYECHGGMFEAIMPVREGGRLLGFVMIGQFRARKAVPPAILAQARRRGKGAAVRRAYARAPAFRRGKVRHILGLFELLVRFIAERHLIGLEDALAPVLERLRDRPEERLTLPHAAALVHRSPSTLSHLVRRRLGKSFRRLRVELALDRADALFRESPGIRVKEVAHRLGYDDPLYFSRLYRRHRGVPPRAAARRLAPRREPPRHAHKRA